jgi:hypothetical protein
MQPPNGYYSPGSAAHPAAAPWFRPYLSGGGTSHPPVTEREWEATQPNAWPPRPVPPNPAPTRGGLVDPLTAPFASVSRPGAPFGLDERGLPRRNPGAQLSTQQTAEHRIVAAPPGPAAGPVDPELVRARLSAFAEGVSAALRRSNGTVPAQKDR